LDGARPENRTNSPASQGRRTGGIPQIEGRSSYCPRNVGSVEADFLKQVINSLVALRHNGVVLDELDITTSFATLAHEKNLTRPILNEGYED